MIDLHIRVKTPVVWLQKARDLGLREGEGDEERWKPGVNVDDLGEVWTTRPVFDENGVQTQPGTKAPGRHLNIRIDNPEVETALGLVWEQDPRKPAGAINIAPSNNGEIAWNWRGVELVDMTTVATPKRVWL